MINENFNFDSPEFISMLDELPLWSAQFGFKLLENVEYKKSAKALDIGCCTGFPIIELSQRFGISSQFWGIDPWAAALKRLQQKIDFMKLKNINIIEGVAENLPFENSFFDLVISNNGLNNVQDIDKSMSEISRVMKQKAQLVFTLNLPDTMKEFYEIFSEVLVEFGLKNNIDDLKSHIHNKRKPLDFWLNKLNIYGFDHLCIDEGEFKMHFIDGSSFINHYVIRFAFRTEWEKIVPKEFRLEFFKLLESRLNDLAYKLTKLILSIPFACISCRKK